MATEYTEQEPVSTGTGWAGEVDPNTGETDFELARGAGYPEMEYTDYEED